MMVQNEPEIVGVVRSVGSQYFAETMGLALVHGDAAVPVASLPAPLAPRRYVLAIIST